MGESGADRNEQRGGAVKAWRLMVVAALAGVGALGGTAPAQPSATSAELIASGPREGAIMTRFDRARWACERGNATLAEMYSLIAEMNVLRAQMVAAGQRTNGGPFGVRARDRGRALTRRVGEMQSEASACERRLQEAARQAAARPARPPVTDAEIIQSGGELHPHRARLEQIVATDAAGWSSNIYSAGTMRGVTIEGDMGSGNYSLRGEYSYRRSMLSPVLTGWVIARFERGFLHCLEYHDIGGRCRRPHEVDTGPLGREWTVRESGWTGTFTRRHGSETFDAVWRRGDRLVWATMLISVVGGQVTMHRLNSSDGNVCDPYVGTLTGRTASGTYRCEMGGAGRWSATIR